jgi:uncharacterized protein
MARKRAGRRSNGRLEKRTVKPSVLSDIVQHVVDAAEPDKIILFGSAARGEMGPNSDIDLLVIKSGKFDRRRVLAKIYRQLRGDEAAIDVVLASTEDIRLYGDSPYQVYYPALQEGTVVYGA